MQLKIDKASDSADNSDLGSQQNVRRLPCKGCTTGCGLYANCKGAPWRLRIAVPSADQADETLIIDDRAAVGSNPRWATTGGSSRMA